MLDAQKPLAEWMKNVIDRRQISARKWAELAGLGKDTVSRAIKDDCTFVTKPSTLVKLADALAERAPGVASAIPDERTLFDILEEVTSALLPDANPTPQALHAFARALRDTLLHIADENQSAADPRATRMLTRAALRQLRRPSA